MLERIPESGGHMNRLTRHRPSPAMVVACVALGIALTGTSVAAVSALAPNSVGTAQIKPNAVTAAKIKNANVTGAKIARNAITGSKVLNRSLTAADFVASSLPKGPAGPTGPAGPAGPAGAAGPAGTIGPVTVRQAGVVVPGGVAQNGAYDTETVTVNCNQNERAISAGTGWSDDAADRELWTQRMTPIVTNNVVTGFRGTGGNDSGNSSTFTLYVLCYTP
jgi:hypothetical protein